MDLHAGAGPHAAGGGGRPDERFPPLSALRQEVGAEGVLLSVVSSVNLTTKHGTIAFVHPVANLQASGIDRESQVVIRSKRADGTPLDEFPVTVKLNSELAPEDDRTGLVDAVLPVSGETKTIELVIDGQVADTFKVVGTPPAVRAVNPVSFEGRELRVALEFEHEMEEAHTYAVQASVDRGQTWHTIAVGLREHSFTIDRSQFPEGQDVQIRIITTNGLSAYVTTSQPFRIADPEARP